MFRDITIGQYYPANSIIHRLDPRVKLLGAIVYIAALFIINSMTALAALTCVMFLLIKLSRVPVRFILRGMRALLFLLIVAVFFNLFFTDGNILWSFWIFKISEEGIYRAVFFGVRLVCVIVGASLLTYTTTPTTLTAGLESAFHPLERIRFPAHEMAMMMSIALRFIPILSEEVNKIIKAQLARGADFETGGLIKKAKGMIPILIPLFVSAFKRAQDLAEAMEARCYRGGEGRTKMYPLKYAKRDAVSYGVIFLYLAASVCMRVFAGTLVPWGIV